MIFLLSMLAFAFNWDLRVRKELKRAAIKRRAGRLQLRVIQGGKR